MTPPPPPPPFPRGTVSPNRAHNVHKPTMLHAGGWRDRKPMHFNTPHSSVTQTPSMTLTSNLIILCSHPRHPSPRPPLLSLLLPLLLSTSKDAETFHNLLFWVPSGYGCSGLSFFPLIIRATKKKCPWEEKEINTSPATTPTALTCTVY